MVKYFGVIGDSQRLKEQRNAEKASISPGPEKESRYMDNILLNS